MHIKHHGAPFDCGRALWTIFDDVLVQQQRPLRHSARRVSSTAYHNVSRGPSASHRSHRQIRGFHDYFVTHLPKSSIAPESSSLAAHHKLPRSDSKPHEGPSSRRSALLAQSNSTVAPAPLKDTTVVRIPLKSAKHHFGASVSRGSRPYNEDTYQAGTVELPAFAARQPRSLILRPGGGDGSISAPGETGDPQVFYFGVFDGHGGKECSEFLRDRLHAYVEETALLFGMESSLQDHDEFDMQGGVMGEQDPEDLQKSLIRDWKETVGGYFKRFKPEHFPAIVDADNQEWRSHSTIETILTYAFLKADLDFTTAQAAKHSAAAEASKKADETSATQKPNSMDDPVLSDRPLNDDDMLYHPEREASQNLSKRPRPNSRGSSPNLDSPIGGSTRFQGGSTASVAMVSTPTPVPFWHPASPSTLVVAHVGDTRVLLCRTSDGAAVPMTANHHPSLQTEASRMRRFATSFVTDSFGEERVLGMANTRAFGDIGSKRIGVSAEPQITTMQLPPAGFAFMVLVSDGVSGHLEDQEIVDIVKDAKTPAQAAESLVNFAVEVAREADNATALVVRLGGWERRSEGGGGSLGTKERRDFRRQEAMDPRSRRQ